MEDINNYTNNLYVIKRRLAERKKYPGDIYFTYDVGQFNIKIFTTRIQDHTDYGPNDSIVNHEVLDVHLYEMCRDTNGNKYDQYIDLEKDTRFKNYKPIKYSEYSGYSTGKEMPLLNLCELVKYLHRLSGLSAFM